MKSRIRTNSQGEAVGYVLDLPKDTDARYWSFLGGLVQCGNDGFLGDFDPCYHIDEDKLTIEIYVDTEYSTFEVDDEEYDDLSTDNLIEAIEFSLDTTKFWMNPKNWEDLGDGTKADFEDWVQNLCYTEDNYCGGSWERPSGFKVKDMETVKRALERAISDLKAFKAKKNESTMSIHSALKILHENHIKISK